MMLAWALMFCATVTLSGACTCVGRSRPWQAQEFCRYDLIVRGAAVSQREEDMGLFTGTLVYTIRVTRAIKAPNSQKRRGLSTFELRTSAFGSMCGTRLRLHEDGVFFGYSEPGGQFSTTMCDPNVAWKDLGESDRVMISNEVPITCSG